MEDKPQVKERDMREAMTAFRKRRGLLSRAYRAFKRDANQSRSYRGAGTRGELLMKAAEVIDKGQAEGINVGGIQRYDQIQDLVSSRLRQTMANTDAMQEAFQRAPQLLPTPKVKPQPQQSVAPLSLSEQDEEVIDWETYDPSYDTLGAYAQQRSLF